MRPRVVIVGLPLVVGLVMGQAAAPAPNFAGTWAASKDAPATLPVAPTAIFGARFEFRQAGQRLTVVRAIRDSATASEYPLDGSPVRTMMPGGPCQGDSGYVATAAWDGRAIVHKMVQAIPAGGGEPSPLAITQTFRMTGADTLEVESAIRVAGDAAPRAVATVYRRATDPMPPVQATVTGPAARIDAVAWIAGAWVFARGATTIEETWTPPAGGSMLAVGRTLRGGGMPEFEFLCMTERGGTLIYTAMPNARTPATDFTLTSIDANAATFENPSHDFPKKIRYVRRPDGGMDATVSGSPTQQSITLNYTRR